MSRSSVTGHPWIPRCFLPGILLFILSFPVAGASAAQDLRAEDSLKKAVIAKLIPDGNRLTRPPIIFRELGFHEGDTILLSVLPQLLKSARDNLINTSLFNFVTIDTVHVREDPLMMNVVIHVIERWYIWPWPYFQISDRNINSWLSTTDWDQVTYGIDMTFYNVRGRNETVTIPLHFGFNQKYGVTYRNPYVNRKKTIGTGFSATYELNHEVVVGSTGNKPVYYEDPGHFARQITDGYLEFIVRPNIYSRNTVRLEYTFAYFSDSLLQFPNYSGTGATNGSSYFTFNYQFRYDHRNIQYYPLKGLYFEMNYVENRHTLFIKTSLRKYWQIYNRWYFASGLYGKYTILIPDAYYLQRGLGYGSDYVRGYEYYVIDGQHFVYMKNNLKFAILSKRVFQVGFLKNPSFSTVHYALYANLLADLGYVYNTDAGSRAVNSLQNHFLIGYGAGVDFATYYDIVVRLEFTINGMGKPGLYLHFVAPI